MTAKVKPSMSRDGVERIEMRVPVRVSRVGMVNALAGWVEVKDDLPELSRERVFEAVRDAILTDGGQYAQDDKGQGRDIREWAECQVAKVWPPSEDVKQP